MRDIGEERIAERVRSLTEVATVPPVRFGPLDDEIAALETELRAAGFKPRREQLRPNTARFNEITVGDAAEQVLRRRGKPMRLTEIVAEIERRGLYQTKSPHQRSTVATALKRENRFEKVGHGLYRWIGGEGRP